jgi:hypothetical protein
MRQRLILFAPTIVFVCAVQTTTLRADAVTEIFQPPQFGYDTSTASIGISGLSDYESVGQISGGGLEVNFAPSMVKLSIPEEWGSWGSPPNTELNTAACPSLGINCPPVLWSNGNDSVTMTFSSSEPVSVFGFEAEPDNPAVEPMTATFYLTDGTTHPIDLFPNGYYGALLFAVSSSVPIDKVTLTNGLGDDFAIADVRFGTTPLNTTPEPSTIVLSVIGSALMAIPAVCRRLRRR